MARTLLAAVLTLALAACGSKSTPSPRPAIVLTDSVAPTDDHTLDFGSVLADASTAQTVTISNAGDASLVLGVVASLNPLAAPFSKSADGCSSQTLAAGASCTFTVTFAPTAAGGVSDTFDVPSNDASSPTVTVSVSGTGVGPAIAVTDSISPVDDATVPFGDLAVGSTATETVTIANAGGGDLQIGTLGALSAPFSFGADGCTGQALPAGGSCTVTLRFSPTAAGSFSASFAVPSNDPLSPSTPVTVTGTGLAPAIAVTDSVAPASDLSVPFGSVLRSATGSNTVTITNAGGADLVLGTIASANPLAAPFSIAANPCSGATLAPAASCTVTLQFAPTAIGVFADSFDIPSNDATAPSKVIGVSGKSPAVGVAATGQTQCFDAAGAVVPCAGSGQEGAVGGVAWPTPRFTAGTGTTASCVTDNLTGLMWMSSPDATKRTWSGALAYVNGLSLCGYSDWRLPNVNELKSLLNLDSPNESAWLNGQGFSNVQQVAYYWSSTTNGRYTYRAYAVYGWTGGVIVHYNNKNTAEGYTMAVRGAGGGTVTLPATGITLCYDDAGATIACAGTRQDGDVRAGAALPSPRFTQIASNKIAVDNLTGIEWLIDANVMKTRDPSFDADGTAGDGLVTWQHALDYVAKLNAEGYLGHSDWRLPNAVEQQTMLDYSNGWPAFTTPFQNINYMTWTSSTYALAPTMAWSIYFYDASMSGGDKAGFAVPWPIRGP